MLSSSFVLGLWLLLFILPTEAQSKDSIPIAISLEFTEKKIGNDIAILEDKGGQLSLEQVQSPHFSAQFVPSDKDSPSFGYTYSAFWARFIIEREGEAKDSKIPLFLTLDYGQTDLAQIWCQDERGTTVMQAEAGDHVPRGKWPTTYRELAFVIPPNAINCWIRVESSASMQFPLTLYSQQAFIEMRLKDNALQALYFGALLVMLTYNSLVAISTWSIAYFSYSLFLLSYGFTVLSMGGLGYAIFWKDAIGFADSVLPFSMAFNGISSLFFTNKLLDLDKTSPTWSKICISIIWLGVPLLLVTMILPYPFAIKSVLVFGPPWAVVLLGSGIYLTWRGLRIAKIFLAAWTIFILGTLIRMGVNLSWIPNNAISINATQIGSAIEFVLLSFALADRLKTTQMELLHAQKKIAEGLRLSEKELTQIVSERTSKLEIEKQKSEMAFEKSNKLSKMMEVIINSNDTSQILKNFDTLLFENYKINSFVVYTTEFK